MMPGYRTHVAVGVGFFLLLMLCMPGEITFGSGYVLDGLLAVILGSLFPDIDIKSKGQKVYAVIIMLLFVYCMQHGRYDYLPIVCIALLFPLFVTHRGITHNPWFILCLLVSIGGMGVFLLGQNAIYMTWFLSCFGAAALLHIILDVGVVRFCKKLVRLRVK